MERSKNSINLYLNITNKLQYSKVFFIIIIFFYSYSIFERLYFLHIEVYFVEKLVIYGNCFFSINRKSLFFILLYSTSLSLLFLIFSRHFILKIFSFVFQFFFFFYYRNIIFTIFYKSSHN